MPPYYYSLFGARDQFIASSPAELVADATSARATVATLLQMDRLADGRDAHKHGLPVFRGPVAEVAAEWERRHARA